ncbi:MAG: histidinol-phosphate transaminase [Candidatus Nanopelagicales bacterium]|nr:histidinol-phosphate transaminase [Candidatus Nanopelagicales bacterium]MCF8538353.1 histidinol-phosphate transaminase [Candidatus Nanopelagicales bacterium]
MLPRLRPVLESIPAYRAGRPAPVREGVTPYKLSSNENHHQPLPSVLRAAEQALADLHRYPDFASTALVDALAAHFDIPSSDIAVGTGSVGLLQQLVQITSGPGDGVLYAWRSFEAYPIVTQIAGATPQQVPLDSDARHDLDAMLAAIDDTTRIVMVCNPNNPTSTAVDRSQLEQFLQQVPSDILVVIDEAYREFVDAERIPDGLDYYRQYENVAVLRTFSKAYGLAALRVGFCVAREPVAEALRKVQVPFGVSTVAQAAAIASLDAEDELLQRVSAIVQERNRVASALSALGLMPCVSEANFLWLPLVDRAMSFSDACAAEGLSVRPFPGEGVRVTIGEMEGNDRLLEVAASWQQQSV